MTATEQAWQGADVGIPEVLRQLNKLRIAAAREQIKESEHIHPRNSVLDVIVVASEDAEAERAARVIEELAAHHPCRALVVLDEPGGGESRIDATVTSITHTLVTGAACQYEQVFLRARGPAAEHIPSLVDALLLPDVVTFVWWTGSAPVGAKRFSSTLAAADVLLVDSSRFERPYEAFATLAKEAASSEKTTFGDFQWMRLQPWREVLAQFFNPADRRGFLRGIGAVGIEYVGEGRGNRGAAALLAGWLDGALEWSLQRAASGTGGVMAGHYVSAGGHPVEVHLRPVQIDGFAPGEIGAVRVEAVYGGQTCRVQAVRDPADSDHVVLEGELRGAPIPRLVLPVPSSGDAGLLSRLLIDARADRVYPTALARAARLLEAARG
jgi:glucose-6-phosphate dehydrogenase assembly protein OpcA